MEYEEDENLSTSIKEVDRRIVPRWRDSKTTVSIDELTPLEAVPSLEPFNQGDLSELLADWKEHRTSSFASDLVGAGFVLGRESEVGDAAEYLLTNSDWVPEPAIRLARRVIGGLENIEEASIESEDISVVGLETSESQSKIHRIRQLLHDDPRNAILWVDMARHYATLGQALRAMRNAVTLAPNNRFALRSAARLHVHIGDPEEAQQILLRSDATVKDPWLRAAEIAISNLADRPSKFAKSSRRALGSTDIHPSQISELASAVATLELTVGNARGARKFFNQALIDPTDNSVAQANWASRFLSNVGLEEKHLALPRTYEANAWSHYYAGKWSDSFAESLSWFRDEPFSAGPPTIGSFIAIAALKDFEMEELICRLGLKGNPNDQVLRNNLVVALIEMGELEKADEEYRAMDKSHVDSEILYLATGGLLAFRHGQISEGRQRFRKAIDLAEKHSEPSLRATGLLSLAREEVIAGDSLDSYLAKEAEDAAKGKSDPQIKLALAALKDLAHNPGDGNLPNYPTNPPAQ